MSAVLTDQAQAFGLRIYYREELTLENIKPHSNLLTPTFAQKNKHNPDIFLLPQASHYRWYLEPFVNDIVYLECSDWIIKSDVVDGRQCDRILLKNAFMVGAKKHDVIDMIRIEHIWTVVDRNWKYRNPVEYCERLRLKGFLYMYGSNGERNIGFQTLYAKAIFEDSEEIR